MNNVFSFHRFFNLLKKHTTENLKKYLLSLAALTGLLIVLLAALTVDAKGMLALKTQALVFTSFFLFGGILFTSTIFTELRNQRRLIAELTLPVSNLERFLVCWFYSFIVFQLVMISCFFAVDIVMIHIGKQISADRNLPVKNELLSLFSGKEKIYRIFLAYGMAHAISFMGAIFFKKLSLIKTISVVLIFGYLVVQLNKLITSFVFAETVSTDGPFTTLSIRENNSVFTIEASRSGLNIITLMMIALTLLLWTAAFFRLKEKQV